MRQPRKTKTRPGVALANAKRNRKMKVFTLSSAAIDRLGAMAEERGTSRSGLIEALIFEASTAGAAAETVPVEGRRRKRSEIVR